MRSASLSASPSAGLRDSWRVETEEGARLLRRHRPASERLATWFAEGEFA